MFGTGTVRKIVVAGNLSLLVAGCSIFGYVAPDSKEGYFTPKSTTSQDPYWQRFYELEEEIAQLKAQMNKGDTQALANAVDQPLESQSHSTADVFLSKLRLQADQAVQVIDSVLASLLEKSSSEPKPVSVAKTEPSVGSSTVGNVAAEGMVQRSENGEVVSQVNFSQQRQSRYNYTLVYVYPEPRPWNEMWDKLEAANEQDKWRGYNADKLSYFIYVGAYLREQDAQQRQTNLVGLFGEGPELRAHAETTALASK